MIKPSSFNLYCADLDASARFYRDLMGLELIESEPHEPEHLRHFEMMFGDHEALYLYFVLFEAASGLRSPPRRRRVPGSGRAALAHRPVSVTLLPAGSR